MLVELPKLEEVIRIPVARPHSPACPPTEPLVPNSPSSSEREDSGSDVSGRRSKRRRRHW